MARCSSGWASATRTRSSRQLRCCSGSRLNIFLPSWLKKISILYYLRSLTPVEPGLYGPGALIGGVADPASTPVAIVSLFAITSVLLLLAANELKRSEISYSSD